MKNLLNFAWLDQINLANRVTLLRIALIPLCITLLLTGFYGLAATVFFLLSLSDAIDGFIARKYHQVSEIGKMLDPLADKILVITVLIGMAAEGLANPAAVMLIAARELIVSSVRARKIFPASPIAKWKTVSQIAAVLMLLFHIPFGEAVLWFAVLFSLISGWAYIWQSRILKQLKLS